MRPQVAIFLDYTIRIPNFQQSYLSFKDSLFKDNMGLESDKKSAKLPDPIRFFWQKELEKVEVMNFYISKVVDNIKDYEVKGNFKQYFFNDLHYRKFLEDYSFNLYSDAEITTKKDIAIINTCQTMLFDVVLFDRVSNSRKVPNTFHFLAKHALFVKAVNFIGLNDKIKEEDFIGIWEPEKDSSQYNKEDSKIFLEWLKDLETKFKASASETK